MPGKGKSRSHTGLLAWLMETARPVFVVDLRRRVRFFNRGCVLLTGCETGDVLGKPCDYTTAPLGALNERILQAIAPPPEVYEGQELFTQIQFINAHGQQIQPQVLYVPLKSEQGEVLVVMGILLEQSESPKPLRPNYPQSLHRELARLLTEQAVNYKPTTLIARSPVMQKVWEQVKLAAESLVIVHLFGESGTGKHYLARLIHQLSRLSAEPAMTLRCQELPDTEQRRLLKDLFNQYQGSQEQDCLILKDVDRLTEDWQVKLYELLSQKKWPRGLRVLTTSRVSLAVLSAQEKFHAGLACYLTPLVIEMPGLSDRQEDLELLIQYFLEKKNKLGPQQLTGADTRTVDLLKQYQWSFHVAELRQMLEEASSNSAGNLILPEHLPFRWESGVQAQAVVPARQPVFRPLEEQLEELERAEILRALEHARENKARAAELLGMTRAKLYRRLEQLGLLADEISEGKAAE